MSDGLNRCEFLGNIAEPELKMTQAGTAVLKFSMAVNSSFIDKNETRQERTEWVRCTMFGKRAEGLAKHLKKGDRLYVAGEMRTSSYEKDGEKRYSTEIVVNELVFAGSKKADGDAPSGGGYERRPAPPPTPASSSGSDDFGGSQGGDDEIPF